VDLREADPGRREFVKKLALAGVAGIAGCAAGPQPAAALGPAAPDTVEVLEQPIVLRTGESLQNRSFVLSGRFRNLAANAIVLVDGDAVRIRNVRIIGPADWQERWNVTAIGSRDAPGVWSRTIGIRAHNVRDLRIERVSIEGLPRAAIAGSGLDRALFRDIHIRHCYHGINFGVNAPSHHVTIARVSVGDLWGPPPEFAYPNGKANHPSRSRPGGWIGGDGFALNSLRDSTLSDCVTVGEGFACFKLTNPHRVTVRGLRGATLQLQGIAGGTAGESMEPARDVLVQDCVFDKGLGYGGAGNTEGCGIQVTYHFGQARIHRCFVNAAGFGGHGIQVTSSSHASVEGCTIRGFNGKRGSNPAYAIHVGPNSSVNADATSVNRFVDQARILLDHDAPPQ
jgi:hypothetical protein